MEHGSFLPLPHHGAIRSAWRAQACEAVHGFEEVRLALGVRTHDEIQPGDKPELHVRVVAEVLELDPAYTHAPITTAEPASAGR